MNPRPWIVIKIGGRPASSLTTLDALLGDIKALGQDYRLVLVHGGGADVSDLSRRLGLEPVFVGGLRQTSPEEMHVVEMVLAGSVNTRILRRCLAQGLDAVGLSGTDCGLFTAKSMASDGSNRTGSIISCSTAVLQTLSNAGCLPVVSSVSCEADGSAALNINADDAAMALAIALKAKDLIFLSDIPGILKDGQVLSGLGPVRAEAEIAAGTIGGGMIPKVRSSIAALREGVGAVIIGGYQNSGDLSGFLNGSLGSSITLED